MSSTSDCSLFLYNSIGKVVYLLVYVDDILVTGNDSQFISKLIQMLNGKFALKDLGSLSYFLGFEAKRSTYGILLTQSKYAHDLLIRTNMVDAKPCSTPMATGTKLFSEDSEAFDKPSLYRSTIGALQYLTMTRPDLSFPVNKLSQFLQNPSVRHWQACKRILRYVKGTLNHGIVFKSNGRLELEGYADADWEKL